MTLSSGMIIDIFQYRDIAIMILLSIFLSLQFKKIQSISNYVRDVNVYVLLQLFYWYCNIYNNRDILNDN